MNPSTASRQCWAIRCTNGATTLTPGGSACGCAPAVEGGIGAGGLSQTCDNIMCAEGQTPVFKNGHCTCGGGGFGGGGGGGPRPPGPMQLPGVPSFGGVRAGEMEMIGMSPDR